MISADEMLIRRYLLGNVTEEQQRRIEERLLTDDRYYSRFDKIEEDLIDDYVRGQLESDDALRFEQHFMSAPGRRESVEFAKALAAAVTSGRALPAEGASSPEGHVALPPNGLSQDPSSYSRPITLYLSASAVLLLVLAVGWLLVNTARLRNQLDRAQIETSRLQQSEERLAQDLEEQTRRNEDLARDLELERAKSARIGREPSQREQLGAPQTESDLVSVLLKPGLTRSQDEPPLVRLSLGIRRIELKLKLPVRAASYSRYRAELQTVELQTVWSKADLKTDASNNNTVVITVPAQSLTRSDYLVRLSGIAADGTQKILNTYHFKVVQN